MYIQLVTPTLVYVQLNRTSSLFLYVTGAGLDLGADIETILGLNLGSECGQVTPGQAHVHLDRGHVPAPTMVGRARVQVVTAAGTEAEDRVAASSSI